MEFDSVSGKHEFKILSLDELFSRVHLLLKLKKNRALALFSLLLGIITIC